MSYSEPKILITPEKLEISDCEVKSLLRCFAVTFDHGLSFSRDQRVLILFELQFKK